MTMQFNSPRRVLIIWIVITSVALIGIFIPLLLGIESQQWAVAFSDLCFYITLFGILSIIVFLGRSRVVSAMLKEKMILAHWTYTPEEWKEFTEYQWAAEKKEKKILFYMLTGFVVVIGALFVVMTVENAYVVVIFGVAVIVITGFLCWISAWGYHRENLKYQGEVYIAENAAYIARRLHLWKGLGAKLESLKLIRKGGKHLLEIYYTSPIRFGLQNYPVIVPIPSDKIKEAKAIMDKFGYDTKINPEK
jgi:hypothetical protein